MSVAPPDLERRALLDAVLARLIPADEHGPGAREAGALEYLECSPVDERERCERGLAWLASRAATDEGAAFEQLDGPRQDVLLAALEEHPEHGACFELIRRRATFPTSGGHNPTLTLQALAWRTATHWVARAARR